MNLKTRPLISKHLGVLGSWSQFMRKSERGLSMNLGLPRKPLTPSLSPSDGERVAAGRVRGFRGAMRERMVRGILSVKLLGQFRTPEAEGRKLKPEIAHPQSS
jgi:hypothetical protein